MKLATPSQLRAIVILHEQRDIPVAGSTTEEAIILERIFDVGCQKMVSYQEAEACIRYLNRAPRVTVVVPNVQPPADTRTSQEKHFAGDCECQSSGVRCSWYSWQYQTEWGRAENE